MRRPLAVVTGAGSGIGAAVAARLAVRHDLVLTHLTADDALNKTITDAKAVGAAVSTVLGDLTQPATRRRFEQVVRADHHRLDVLVCNAGAYPRTPWEHLDTERFRGVLELNLTSHMTCVRAVTPGMVHRRYGRIIAISTVLTQVGRAELAAYIAAKSGLEGLVHALARELGPCGITVNGVRPGSVEVDTERHVVDDLEAMTERQLARQCIKRRGTPQDVAVAVEFLASENAGFITGQHLTVDGGWYLS